MGRRRPTNRGSTSNPPPSSGPLQAAWSKYALAVFCAALLLRLFHIWQLRKSPFASVLIGDSRGYDEWARRIAGGEWIGTEVFYQAPLYPYFVGVIYSVVGPSVAAVRFCQAFLGSAACVLLGHAAEKVSSTSAGLIAGLALALYAPAIFFDGLIQKSSLDVFLICLVLWLVSGIVASGSSSQIGHWFALGLAMGALALTRENALALIGVILIWSMLPEALSVRRGSATRLPAAASHRRWGGALAFVVGLAAVLTPVAARNAAVGGGFYLTTSQFGPNLFIGNNPRADGTYMSLRPGRGAPEYERVDATELAQHALGRTLRPDEVSSYWTDRAVRFITSQPMAWLRLTARKVLLLGNADEMLDTESQEAHAEWSWPVRVLGVVTHFGILVPLAAVGMWATWPDRRRMAVFYAMTAAYAASVVLFYVFARYRFPLVPLLILFATVGGGKAIVLARRCWAERHAGRCRWGLMLGIGAAIFANWPVLSTSTMRAVTENNLATALQAEGRLDDAVAHYRRALEFEGDYAPAYSNMGTALRAKGQLDAAIDAYSRALRLMPDYPDARYNLANALFEQGKAHEAAEHFRIALQSIPGSAAAHNNLGIALDAEGKHAEAIEEFRKALQNDPSSARTLRNLGNSLAELGRYKDAISELQRAVKLSPTDGDAHYDLAHAYLEAGSYSEAVSEFQASLELLPRSAAAHNNLGVALAAQGRLEEAVSHFRKALDIQPDFADARRNLELARTVR